MGNSQAYNVLDGDFVVADNPNHQLGDQANRRRNHPHTTSITYAQMRNLIRGGLEVDLALIPYQLPRMTEPMPELDPVAERDTVTLSAQCHIRKDTVQFIEVKGSTPKSFTLQCTVDALVPCSLEIFYICKEIVDSRKETLRFEPQNPLCKGGVYTLSEGIGQIFHVPDSEALTEVQLDGGLVLQNSGVRRFHGAVVVVKPLSPQEQIGISEKADSKGNTGSHDNLKHEKSYYVRSETSYFTLIRKRETSTGDSYVGLKPSGQKMLVNDKTHELQEIYGKSQHHSSRTEGVEDYTASATDVTEEQEEEECVICLTEPRDTTLLPCRHMCLCNSCAHLLRSKDNRCPICRRFVESLLTFPKATYVTPPETTAAASESKTE